MTNFSNYQNKTILVTGGSGFIGSKVCDNLIQLGASIHSVSRKIKNKNKDIKWWQGDLSEIEFVQNLFSTIHPEIVIHLASEVTGKREIDHVLPTLHGNLISTINLLVCTTQYGCKRLILAGSLEEPEEDATAPIPASPYAAAKWASSSYARMFFSLYKTPVVIARLFMVYGPNQKDLKKFIPYITLSLLNNQKPNLADGSREVDWIYVDDVVEGLIKMCDAPDIENQTIDLGTGQLHSTRHVAEQLCTIDGKKIFPNFGAIPERPMEQVKKANIQKSQELLKWTPQISLKDGLKKTYDWYKTQSNSGVIDLKNIM